MSSNDAPPIFVVEDEPEVVITIDRLLKRAWPLRVARTFKEAVSMVEAGGAISAAIVDVVLPDGSGINLLSLLRDAHPTTRVLVLTAHAEPELINTAQLLGAEYAIKPHFAENVRAFAARVKTDGSMHVVDQLRGRVADFAKNHRLTPREAEIVQMAVSRVSRDEMAAILRVTLNTLKTETRGLLIKCGAQNLLEIAARIRVASDFE